MSKIAVLGTGYVGLVSGAMFADFGHTVICVDIDEKKIQSLKNGKIPIFEPGLETVVRSNSFYKRLDFTTDTRYAVENSDIIFIAVGTPQGDDGTADLQYVLAAAEDIAGHMNGYKIIVDKSTVPVGTSRLVRERIASVLARRGAAHEFDVVSNPEFLREGSAVYDFTHPDRVVLGCESPDALSAMKEVYRVLYLNETPFVETNPETAEMIKYASNAFLAVKISYINEIANICERVGADVQKVAKAMGQDGRISPKFLHAGPGYGGSCFPKDTRALSRIARQHGEVISVVDAAIEANERQKQRMVEKVSGAMGDLHGRTLAVLGITFKPNTDDMRESPALVILPELVGRGATLRVFDPEGAREGAWRLASIAEGVRFCDDEYDAIKGADGIILLTQWHQFRNLDFDRVSAITEGRYFFDFRNVYDRAALEGKGFAYYGVGR